MKKAVMQLGTRELKDGSNVEWSRGILYAQDDRGGKMYVLHVWLEDFPWLKDALTSCVNGDIEVDGDYYIFPEHVCATFDADILHLRTNIDPFKDHANAEKFLQWRVIEVNLEKLTGHATYKKHDVDWTESVHTYKTDKYGIERIYTTIKVTTVVGWDRFGGDDYTGGIIPLNGYSAEEQARVELERFYDPCDREETTGESLLKRLMED